MHSVCETTISQENIKSRRPLFVKTGRDVFKTTFTSAKSGANHLGVQNLSKQNP